MIDIKIVIGANFGDEGKGLITDYISSRSYNTKSTIVVCSNGGPQRGHTVISDNKRHVFKHFGSGTLRGVATYLCSKYIINPILFREEYEELVKLGVKPIVYYNANCIFTTPFDMILNQLVEDHREISGEGRHGSCGLGIWETIKRDICHFYIGSIDNISYSDLRNYLFTVRKYFLRMISEYDISIDELDPWKDIIYNDNIIDNYIEDFIFMRSKSSVVYNDEFLTGFDTIIFENGQGLLLDQSYGDNTTPSNTGIKNPLGIIRNLNIDDNDFYIEVIYVSRSYMTRHGAGDFSTECTIPELFNSKDGKIYDNTNIYNPYQGELRYGKLDIDDLIYRVKSDYYSYDLLPDELSLAITHLDQLDIDIDTIKKYLFEHNDICKIYLSKGPKSTDIEEYRSVIRRSIDLERLV